MAACPRCGGTVSTKAAFCSSCGFRLRPDERSTSPSSTDVRDQAAGLHPSTAATNRTYVALGFVSAFLALLVVPELFGSAAVLLGAYVWRREARKRGLVLILVGLVCLLIGVYLTSYFELGDLLP